VLTSLLFRVIKLTRLISSQRKERWEVIQAM